MLVQLAQRIEAVAALSILKILSFVPLAILTPLANGFGTLAWSLCARRRHIAMRNLDIAFRDTKSPRQKRFLARRSFQHCARIVLTLIVQDRVLRSGKHRWQFDISQEDNHTLEECADKPTAVLAAHAGDWELTHFYLGQRGYPLHVLTRNISNPFLDRALTRLRERRGGSVIPKQGALTKVRTKLREGKKVGLLVDQNDPTRANFFEFFGVPASTYTGYARLLLRARCHVIHVACIYEDAYHYRICVRKLHSGTGKCSEKDAEALTRDYLQATEELIRTYPEQYLWLHRRWKSRPTNAPWLYHRLGTPLDLGLLTKQCDTTLRRKEASCQPSTSKT